MAYLLDTCAISDFIWNRGNTAERLKAENTATLFISVISRLEIEYGLALNPPLAKKIKPILTSLMLEIPVLDFDEDSALKASHIRAHLRQQGTPIGPYDLLIAATALTHDLVLVTSNTKEFERIEGLTTEDWR